LLVLCIACAAGILAAPWLVRLFAGGFAEIPGQLERTVTLTRLFFPYIVFMGTAALGLAALNTYGRYVVTAFAPGLLNVGFIVCALCLPAFLLSQGYHRTLALVIGVWIGGVLQVVAQWPSLARIDMLRRPRRPLGDPDVRLVIKRMAPVIFGMGVYYLDVMVGRNLLSESGVGATSYFNFALRLCDLPQGIFVMALQAATLPSLSRLAAQKDMEELKQTFAFGARLSLFAAIPAALLLGVLAEPIVVLVFQRGQFDAVAAHETGRALLAQASGVWTVAMVRQLVGLSYALGDTRLPVIVSALDFLVFLGLALWLRGPLGHVGISWAVSGSSLVQMTLLWFLIARRLNGLLSADIARALGRALLAALPAAMLAALVVLLLQPVATGALGRALPGAVAAACFGVVFLFVAAATKSPELEAIRAGILRRKARKSAQ
jgi:putative peptidoglycan lipid II flippase